MSSAPSPDNAPAASTQDAQPKWEPVSPFLDRLTPAGGPLSPQSAMRITDTASNGSASPYVTESPFLSVYESGEGNVHASPQAAELFGILAELRDPEFDGAVYQLQAEAYDLLAPRIDDEEGLSDYEIENFMEGHFGPLVRETSLLLDEMAAEVDQHDLGAMTEHEIDELLDRFEPGETALAPAFENFVKKVFKKAKKAVKKAASAVKKGVVKVAKTVGKVAAAPVAMVLKKLKKLVKPLLRKVLGSAIDRLPESLQAAAKQAAQKLFGDKAKVESDPEDSELLELEAIADSIDADGTESTDEELAYLQSELDFQIANLVLAEDETRQDLALAEYESQSRRSGAGPRTRLRRARRRLSRDLRKLDDGADPTPAVEQFIPALLPVLKLGLKVIGRKRVVETIGKLVGKLLRPFVGPKMSRPLAEAIVGTGFRLVGLEMSEDDQATIAADATVAVVEKAVRNVAQLPAEVLEDELLLEAAVEEAFDDALGGSFPPMPGRPELISSELPGSWTLRGEYKRFEPGTPTKVKITQAMAKSLKTFGGGTPTVLGQSLKDLVGREATVHLYEAIPGTWLSKITRDEKDVHGLGGIEEVMWRSIHPLTTSAAATILKDSSMGTDVDSKFLATPDLINVGQRFYYLEITGTVPGREITRDSAFYYVLDCPNRFSSMTFYLSEKDAQRVAKHLRAGNHAKGGAELAKVCVRVAVETMKKGGKAVDIRKEAIELEHALPALRVVMPVVLKGLRRLAVALGPPIAKLLLDKLLADKFIELADHPKQGITFKLTWKMPAGLNVICRVLNAKSVPLKEVAKAVEQFVKHHVNNLPKPQIRSGHHRD